MADAAPVHLAPGMKSPGVAPPVRPWRRVAIRAAIGLAAALALGLVYAAWQNPHLAVDLANAVWSCF